MGSAKPGAECSVKLTEDERVLEKPRHAFADVVSHVGRGLHCEPGSVLVLELLNVKTFGQRSPELYEAVVDGVAFVNWRRLETGGPAVLAISFRK
jgi:hypothetical protein